jgi:hypothetical protein
MPVTYEIDPVRGVIRKRCTGRLTPADITGHFEALLADPACPRRLGVLLDMTGLTAVPDADLVRLLGQEVALVRDRVTFGPVAVVVAGLAAFGIARMGQILMEDQFSAMHVFQDLPAAETWLERKMADAT